MTDQPDRLRALEMAREALADDAKATPGPWQVKPDSERLGVRGPTTIVGGEPNEWGPSVAIVKALSLTSVGRGRSVRDPLFIVAARTREPILAREVLRLTEECERLQSKIVAVETTWSEACKAEARDCECSGRIMDLRTKWKD